MHWRAPRSSPQHLQGCGLATGRCDAARGLRRGSCTSAMATCTRSSRRGGLARRGRWTTRSSQTTRGSNSLGPWESASRRPTGCRPG
eukprot:16439557-Heterocapsa_arctica.AAC.2